MRKQGNGFTLIEVLVVIGIIAILAAIVIVAINPAKQFAQARITQRQSNVATILNAIGQRMADNKGVFEGAYTVGGDTYVCPKLPTTETAITTEDEDSAADMSGKLRGCLVPTYVSSLPVDPAWESGDDTLYTVKASAQGRVTVCSSQSAEPSVPDSGKVCLTR